MCVLPAEQAFFPLDEELEFLPGSLTPNLQEDLVHLGIWMPFGRAVKELEHFRGVPVSRPTVERLTEAAGAAYVTWQTDEVDRIEKELPPPSAGPKQQFLSVDGAMVPLVGGTWAEVKTLALGEVLPAVEIKGERVIRTDKLSYFSRMIESDTFQRLALVETQRRGVETAGEVGAVTDGSDWIQGFDRLSSAGCHPDPRLPPCRRSSLCGGTDCLWRGQHWSPSLAGDSDAPAQARWSCHSLDRSAPVGGYTP